MVVFTDGRNEDDPVSIGLQQLATALKEAADPKRPVELTVVAYGKLPEVAAWRTALGAGGRVRVRGADAGRRSPPAFLHAAASGLHI